MGTAPVIPLNYGRSGRRVPRWLTKTLLVVLVLIALASTPAMITKATFSYTSICPVCGDVQESVDWQVPFTHFTYRTTARVNPSALSKVLADRQPAGAHLHEWRFALGGGNGVRCALGDGAPLLMNVARRPSALAFIDATLAYGDAQQVAEVNSLLRDRDRVRYLDMAAGSSRFPESGVKDQAEYVAWWSANGKGWREFWAMLTP
jgi:hypothetical protein